MAAEAERQTDMMLHAAAASACAESLAEDARDAAGVNVLRAELNAQHRMVREMQSHLQTLQTHFERAEGLDSIALTFTD